MAPTEWILCDLGKTLLNFDHRTVARNLGELLAREPGRMCGTVAPTFEAFHAFMFDPGPEGVPRHILLEQGKRDVEWLTAEANRAFELSLGEDEVADLWSNIFTTVNNEVVAAMKRARAHGVRIAICSNTSASHWDHIHGKYPELFGFWDDCFLSFEMGCMKTEPDFFPMILRKTDRPGPAHLFIDDLQENLDAAARMGIETVLFQGTLQPHAAWT